MLPKPIYSNCPLAVLYLWLRGRAKYVVATKSDTPMILWPWHFGVLNSLDDMGIVLHFKRTKDKQYWAPFYFEGKVKRQRLQTVRRGRYKVLWIRRAIYVVPLLTLLVLAGLPIWMTISALYWPCWLATETYKALTRRKGIQIGKFRPNHS